MENKNEEKRMKYILIGIIILLIVFVGIDLVSRTDALKNLFKNENITINKTEKEVTITDEGIHDAVEKLYDATVIVKVGKKDTLSGWGSGVVYKVDDEYAYILTNHHVVDGTTTMEVEFTDGSTTTPTFMGSDKYSDIALLRVDKDSIIAVAELGNSADMKLGDTVFTVGTPISLSYKFTVTRGIISGKDRFVEMSDESNDSIFYQSSADTWFMSLLQIDASINSGNSGGPLANANGELIGITNSKLSSSSGSIENMGFAIPIEDALAVAEQLINNGSITRPVLGVSTTSIEGAKQYNIDIPESVTKGAVIVEVSNGSSADEAGFKSGDVVVKFGDYEITNYQYLRYYLFRYNVGDKVKVEYYRDGKLQTTEVTLKG